MGIDPVTHKPKDNSAGSAQSRQAAVVSHMAQWETARLEAEARLVRESKFLSKLQLLHKINHPPPPPPPQPPCLDVLRVWQNNLFASPGTLDSPTSTLNFSVPTGGECVMAGKVNGYMVDSKGRFENSVQESCTLYPIGDDENVQVSMDHTLISSSDCYSNPTSGCYVGDQFEENKNYWNDLLNLVCSPMESPLF